VFNSLAKGLHHFRALTELCRESSSSNFILLFIIIIKLLKNILWLLTLMTIISN
jgi:hypothetical protein